MFTEQMILTNNSTKRTNDFTEQKLNENTNEKDGK